MQVVDKDGNVSGAGSLIITSKDGKIKEVKTTANSKYFSQTSIGPTIKYGNSPTDLIGPGVGSLVLPANSLQEGDSFTLKTSGLVYATTGDTISLILMIGGNKICGLDYFQFPDTKSVFELEIDFTAVNFIEDPSILATGKLIFNAKNLYNGETFFDGSAIDITVDNLIQIETQWLSGKSNSIYSILTTLIKKY
tara:strand:+ start:1213 stop:1794 length:582 start_codon:yes stop_codon:yes gene_type:complete